jgi:glycogen synthase
MRILIYSPAFAPMIGGIERVMETLATEFTTSGEEVCVVCQATDPANRSFPFRVVRHPGLLELIRLFRWADVVMHANVSLRGLLPFLFVRRPWVATHHGWYWVLGQPMSWQARLKLWASRFATNVACSRAVAEHVGGKCEVIPNPYEDAIFHAWPDIKPDRDVIFVGRLVSDKGVDLIVEALYLLKQTGLTPTPTLTITGSGPEESALRDQVAKRGLIDQVTFTGQRSGEELSRTMAAHRILVVPSRCNEGFGMVALEGAASGCIVIGSEGGGLVDAIGPCGFVVPKEDTTILAEAIQKRLYSASFSTAEMAERTAHIVRHTRAKISETYVHLLRRSICESL